MAKAKQFIVTIEDKPGALGKCFLAPAERGVNILAFQSYVEDGESLARFIVDDSASAKVVLGGLQMIFEVMDVAAVRLAHRPGQLGRAASRLGEKQINIDCTSSGSEPSSTLGLVAFGVDNLSKVPTCWTNWAPRTRKIRMRTYIGMMRRKLTVMRKLIST